MAVTVEELQILLSCDATQAKSVLDTMTGQVDRAVSAMSKKLNGGSFASEAERMTKSASDFMKNGMTYMPKIDTDKLISGTPYERLGEQLKLAQAKIESVRSELARMGDADVSSPAVQKLYTDLIRASDKAEKLAMAMAKIEDAAGQGDGGAKENIRQTGNAAEEASKKVDNYNRSLGKSSKQGSFFSRASGAAHKAFNKFGNSFKHHEGFLSKFGKTLKRVMMRMLAMALIRGVINGIRNGLKYLGKEFSSVQKQMSRFTALGNSVKVAFGSAAFSVLNALAPILYRIASAAITAANAVSRFFAVFGSGKYIAVELADGFDNVGESISGAGGAAKGLLADFDELNIIGQQGGGGGGGGEIAGIGNTTVSEQDATSVLADLIKSQQFEEAGRYIAEKLDGIVLKIDDFILGLQEKHYGTKFAEIVNGIFENKKLFEDAGKTVGDGINSIIYTIEDFASTFDGETAGESLAAGVNKMIETIDWDAAGRAVAEGTNKINDAITEFVKNFNGDALGEGLATAITNAITGIQWDKIGAAGVVLLINAVDFVLSFLANMDWTAIFAGLIELIISAPLQILEGILARPSRLLRIVKNFTKLFFKTTVGIIASVIAGILQYIVNCMINGANAIMPGLGDKLFKDWKDVGKKITDGFNEGVDRFLEPIDKAADFIDEKMGYIDSSVDKNMTHISDSMGTHAGDSGKFISEWGSQVSATAETVNSSLDESASVLDNYKKQAEEMASGVSTATSTLDGFSGALGSDTFSANTFSGLSDSILTLCGLLADVFGVTEKWSDALNKIPKNISTKWTLNANIVASSSGGASAQVNHPNFNVNMAMASGGIAYGETLARIGEYAGARSNPEVVAPLNKLQGILEKTSLNNGGKKETEKQNALLAEQNRLLRIIAEKEIKLSPSPELGQVMSRSAALYGAV